VDRQRARAIYCAQQIDYTQPRTASSTLLETFMITLHHLENSRSQRIVWMLEELGLPYQIKRYERDPKTNLAPPELKAVHPLGKSPVITDDAVTMAESGAIIDYLGQRYSAGRLVPELGTKAHQDYTYWLHYAEGSLMPPLLIRLIFETIRARKMPFLVKPIANRIVNETLRTFVGPQIKTHFDYVESHLKTYQWFAGDDLSGADIQMSFPLEASVARGLGANYPAITAYVKRLHARPAYQRALKAGGDYAYA
jgi:glutathione S-transferase